MAINTITLKKNFENQQTGEITGTCGDASAVVPGFDSTEFATF